MHETDVLIIGAGLAGLSTAYHLKRSHIVLEAENEPGGCVRSVHSGKSVYDFTGHLLHLRTPKMRELVKQLLPDVFAEVRRNAGIFMRDRFLPYPFQANFHGLPPEEIRECLLGFIKVYGNYSKGRAFDNLADWSQAIFGEGISRHFFFPYNEKLYRTSLERMSADWVSWSVPQPSLEQVVDGALGAKQEGMGYNASFLYPKKGGIEVLPRALASQVEPIEYGARVAKIFPVERIVETKAGERYHYNSLVTTMALPSLLQLIENDQPVARFWAAGLRRVNVYNLNLTFSAPPPWDWQWLYLPESEFACYRIGVSSNISPALAPSGACTIYTEHSYLPGQAVDENAIREAIRDDLRRIGLLRSGVEILDETPINIPSAYVVHDHFRQTHLADIHAWLGRRGIISTGRWGAWTYGGMEDAMKQGVTAATLLDANK